jgi:hypothetical protein
MACMTSLAQPMAMATTQLAREISYEVSAPQHEQPTGRQLLRMNWVVVTGKNGSRVLRMQWAADRDS